MRMHTSLCGHQPCLAAMRRPLTQRLPQDVALDLKMPPASPLMVQPPADHKLGEAALCHYTWGAIFKDTLQNDTEVWKFDKRFYTAKETALKVHLRIMHGIPACDVRLWRLPALPAGAPVVAAR